MRKREVDQNLHAIQDKLDRTGRHMVMQSTTNGDSLGDTLLNLAAHIGSCRTALLPKQGAKKSAINRYGVDVAYFKRELAALSDSLENRTPDELNRYLLKLSEVAAPAVEKSVLPQKPKTI
jgi:hypothetical protein